MSNTALSVAQRLRQKAEAMTQHIEASLYSRSAQQRPTARRARLATKLEARGRHLQIVQAALRALAEGHEHQTLPACLQAITSRTAVEAILQYAADAEPKQALLALLPPGVGMPSTAQRIAERERALLGHTLPGFFPTPPTVAAQMLGLAAVSRGMTVLEPSAGKGDLADAIRTAHPEVTIQVVEVQPALREILALKAYEVIGTDFLAFPGPTGPRRRFDRILMNPPFEHEQDITHVRHAYELLAPGGRVVAIMSEWPFCRQTPAATQFRQWLNEQQHYCTFLPDGAFQRAFRATGVHCRIVTVERPME